MKTERKTSQAILARVAESEALLATLMRLHAQHPHEPKYRRIIQLLEQVKTNLELGSLVVARRAMLRALHELKRRVEASQS